MKRSSGSKLAAWLVAAGMALVAFPVLAAEGKIAVVYFERLAEESPQGKAMLESMRAEFAPRQRTLQAQEQALKAKQEKLQKDAATMSEDQRARADKELRDGAREFERARGEFQDDVTARRNEEMSRLQRTLIDEVRTYAKAQNYDVVLSGETVIYATGAYDITPQVLSALQARSGAAATPRPAPAPSKTP